jgi:hypothetical protein
MLRSTKLIAGALAVACAGFAPAALAQDDENSSGVFFAKLTKDGRGAAIVELKGSRKVCVIVAVRNFEPDKVDIKSRGSKGRFKVERSGKRKCQNERGLARRLRDGDRATVVVKGEGDRSSGKLRQAD